MNLKQTILLIEDEKSISNFIYSALCAHGYQAHVASTGAEGKSQFLSGCPDLVLLDLGLPDMDGFEVLEAIRQWSAVPVIVVSARGREAEKVKALDMGADDYITKPFGVSEMMARIRTALRHAGRNQSRAEGEGEILKVQDLVVDVERRTVKLGEKDIHFTQNEFKIIVLLMRYAGKVLTYDMIIREVWGPYTASDNQILRVNMANIRRKLEENPAEPTYILTELGVGYRMLEG